MQGGVGHGHAPHEHGCQLGNRGELAGAADLHIDGQHGGQLLLGRVFVGHGPTGLARDEAQGALQVEPVDFVHRAIDVERQAVSLLAQLGVKAHQICSTRRHLGKLRDRKSPFLKGLQACHLRGPRRAALLGLRDLTHPVSIKTEWALGCDGGVKLSDGTGGGIARVDKGFFVAGTVSDFLALALVQGLEVVTAHVHLAPHLQHGRHRAGSCIGMGGIPRVGAQAQRNLADGADVLGDVFADFAIAPGGGLYQHAKLVTQAHGQAVELGFGHIFDGRVGIGQPEFAADACVEGVGTGGLGVGFGADAEHGYHMTNGGKTVQHLAAHPACGRVGPGQVGVGSFQRLKGLKQTVVLGVGHLGGIQHVVKVRMAVQLQRQRFHFRSNSVFFRKR